MNSFLKMAIKAIITDELAVDLTWRGTPNKPSIQQFTVYNIIKGHILKINYINDL